MNVYATHTAKKKTAGMALVGQPLALPQEGRDPGQSTLVLLDFLGRARLGETAGRMG